MGYARTRSRYYERLYRGLPADRRLLGDRGLLGDLPPVTKPELMGSFDDGVTSPSVTRAGVEAFIADPARIGGRYLDRYFVCASSGTTGRPGLFLHDPGACAVYQALTYRLGLAWLSGRQWLDVARLRDRWAAVVVPGRHRQPGPRRGFPAGPGLGHRAGRRRRAGRVADDERAGSPERWPGLNLLGFALMEVRQQLRA